MLLTADQIAERIGVTRRPAQCRALDAMGVPYCVRPDGSPSVSRLVSRLRRAHALLADAYAGA